MTKLNSLVVITDTNGVFCASALVDIKLLPQCIIDFFSTIKVSDANRLREGDIILYAIQEIEDDVCLDSHAIEPVVAFSCRAVLNSLSYTPNTCLHDLSEKLRLLFESSASLKNFMEVYKNVACSDDSAENSADKT